MSHLNYNHLYYFWMVCKQGSITKAADALFLTPQTVTGQIRTLEQRLKGRLTKRNGRYVEPTELGQLVYKYADRMFGLSYEMMDIVNYSQRENLLFEVGVADALSKELVSAILLQASSGKDGLHFRCFESTHELLLDSLRQHKLDMILSDCPVSASQSDSLFSVKLGESTMSFFCSQAVSGLKFPDCLERKKLLIPGSRTAMGSKVKQWFDTQGITPDILGEFDDAALMKAFGVNSDAIFLAPSSYLNRMNFPVIHEVARVEELKEEYFVIFAERMIRHPAVTRICEVDLADLFHDTR
ncbi:transcriptional activator NhaR [Veronia pacifica]|uniref:Transcriptional activator protein NhaR n=1 Tax=Veronia pacifica TaxID=1080227 RepID=A0A1C3EK14_9GAMM|nr:transcriptional activator NhaR [Veronia pacifica]ODA33577.1 transcriptional activator NhaR [Veronia pacifica]